MKVVHCLLVTRGVL